MQQQTASNKPDLVTLTGFLGRKPEIKTTRTITREIPERRRSDDTHEYIRPADSYEIPGKEFLTASLATHHRENGQQKTTWHRLVVWNVDRDLSRRRPATICRKGSKVKITGRRTSFETEDGRTVEQIEVDEWKIIDLRAPKLGWPDIDDPVGPEPTMAPKRTAETSTAKPYRSTVERARKPAPDAFAERLFLAVRRIDSAWHVVAEDDSVALTHRHPFAKSRNAYRMRDRIRESLTAGRDLDLAHWDVEEKPEDSYSRRNVNIFDRRTRHDPPRPVIPRETRHPQALVAI